MISVLKDAGRAGNLLKFSFVGGSRSSLKKSLKNARQMLKSGKDFCFTKRSRHSLDIQTAVKQGAAYGGKLRDLS